jgi:hypothetical protein
MPWYREAMKDVISCDKPRVGANNLRTVDFRMGKPGLGNARSFLIVRWEKRTEGSETSKYLQEKKSKRFSE